MSKIDLAHRRDLPAPLLAIADLDVLGPALVDKVAMAAEGGLAWVCLRARGAGKEAKLDLVGRLNDSCPALFVSLHGDPSAAAECGAPGLHLPSTGFCVSAVRSACPEALLGVSCHTRSELDQAAEAGADYALLSRVFPAISKEPVCDECPFGAVSSGVDTAVGSPELCPPPCGACPGPVFGPEGFAEEIEGLGIPVLALGGITPERLEAVARAGAAGVAVVGSLFLCSDIKARARTFAGRSADLF